MTTARINMKANNTLVVTEAAQLDGAMKKSSEIIKVRTIKLCV